MVSGLGFAEEGAFAVAAGTAPERLPEVLDVIHSELDRLVADHYEG